MKKNTLVRMSKIVLFTSFLALGIVAHTTKDERQTKKIKQKYDSTKQELVDFRKHRDSLLYVEFNKILQEKIPDNKLGEFFTNEEIKRLNEMIQTHTFMEDSVYCIPHKDITHLDPFLMGRNIYNIVLTPNSSLVDFWACTCAFYAHKNETQNFSTPFVISELGNLHNPDNVFDSTGIEKPIINTNIIRTAEAQPIDDIYYNAPKVKNIDKILQDSIANDLRTKHANARSAWAKNQNVSEKQLIASEKLARLKQRSPIRPTTQTVLNTISADIDSLEREAHNMKHEDLLKQIKQNPVYKLRNALTKQELDNINKQIQNWDLQYASEKHVALTPDNTIFDLANLAHILGADIVYESADDAEFVWANPKLQEQWLQYQNTIANADNHIPKTKQFRSIQSKIDNKKKTLHEIDSLHNAIYNKKIQALTSNLK